MEEGRKMVERKNAGRIAKIVGLVAGIVCVCMICLIVGFKLYYSNRWYPNTTINGLDVSGKTFKTSEKMMQDYVDSYQLEIKGRNDGKLVINGKEIGLSVDYKDKLKQMYQEQKKASFLPNFKQEDFEQEIVAVYEQEKLDNIIKTATIVTGDDQYKIVKPKSAYVQYDEKSGRGEIVKEEKGNKLLIKKMLPVVHDAVKNMETKLDLSKDTYDEVYKSPKITSKDKKIQKQYITYNTCLLNWINWDMGDGIL